jgi:hypothetical protein
MPYAMPECQIGAEEPTHLVLNIVPNAQMLHNYLNLQMKLT